MPSRICTLIGVLFIALGLWGLLASGSFLVFAVNPIHHICQLTIGGALLWAGSWDGRSARVLSFAAAFGFGCLALTGFLDVPGVVDLLDLRPADHWLHALMAAVLLAAAMTSRIALLQRRGVAGRAAGYTLNQHITS